MGRKKLVSDERLLETARKVFVELGLTASTREIARRAGVSEAVLFQRYETKADLFLAAMVPPVFDLKACLSKPVSRLSGERVLRDLTFGLLDYFRTAAPVTVQLLANQDFQFEKFARAHPDNPLAALRWSLVDFLSALKTAGKLGADPAPAALALFTATHSLALFERFGAHEGRLPDQMLEALVAALWRGFRPAPKRARSKGARRSGGN